MNNENKLSEKVYIDANFLISYWIPKHEFHNAACLCFFKLIESNSRIFLSPLVIDETWYIIWHILKRQNLPPETPFKNFYQDFKKLLNFIISFPLVEVVQLKHNLVAGCQQALENIKIYNFKPHDAFHLAMMEDNQISAIITKDSDFTKVSNKKKLERKGITVISF